MLCQICHAAEATVHLLETTGSKQTSLHMCEACAQKKHISEMLAKPALAIHELLASIMQLGSTPEPEGPELKCPRCGLAYSQFKQAGRLGCADCYEAFQERLLPLLRQFHQAEEHKGRREEKSQPLPDQIRKLREDLRRAVSDENFELAAGLRDRIKDLEGHAKP